MSISASDVKNLREKTGLGMMECKKALEEANGDAELAITNLRKNSALKAEKKSSRTAVEGIILADTANSDNSILIEINCETDFVAKDESFLNFTITRIISFSWEPSITNFLESLTLIMVWKFDIVRPRLPNILSAVGSSSKKPKWILAGEFKVNSFINFFSNVIKKMMTLLYYYYKDSLI